MESEKRKVGFNTRQSSARRRHKLKSVEEKIELVFHKRQEYGDRIGVSPRSQSVLSGEVYIEVKFRGEQLPKK